MLRRVVRHVLLPAGPEHAAPGAPEDANRVRVLEAAVSRSLVDGARPRHGVARGVGKRAEAWRKRMLRAQRNVTARCLPDSRRDGQAELPVQPARAARVQRAQRGPDHLRAGRPRRRFARRSRGASDRHRRRQARESGRIGGRRRLWRTGDGRGPAQPDHRPGPWIGAQHAPGGCDRPSWGSRISGPRATAIMETPPPRGRRRRRQARSSRVAQDPRAARARAPRRRPTRVHHQSR